MSDTLLYFLNLFLKTSFIILYFFILQIACSITILFAEWFLLYSFCTSVNSWSFSFLKGSNDFCFWKVFFHSQKSKIKHTQNIFRQIRMVFLVDFIIMLPSYLSVYVLFCRLSVPFDSLCIDSWLCVSFSYRSNTVFFSSCSLLALEWVVQYSL